MKKLLMLLLTLCSCSSKPIKLHNFDNLKNNEIAVITTKCDLNCLKAIGVHLGSALGFNNTLDLSEGALLEIDGKVGERDYKNGQITGKIFNSSWDGSLNIEVAAGVHEFLMDANSRLVWSKPKRFRVLLKGGHTYVVGRIRVEKDQYYTWFPLVYDLTSDVLIYRENS
jgi:hypothetical protein